MTVFESCQKCGRKVHSEKCDYCNQDEEGKHRAYCPNEEGKKYKSCTAKIGEYCSKHGVKHKGCKGEKMTVATPLETRITKRFVFTQGQLKGKLGITGNIQSMGLWAGRSPNDAEAKKSQDTDKYFIETEELE